MAAPVIIFTVRDDKGKTATTEVKIPTGITLSNMIEFAQDLAVLFDAITTGQIINVGIGISVDISALGLTAAPGATSDVEEKGKFQFQTAGGYYTTVNIPCLGDTDVVSGSDALDQTDADISAFIAAMTGGLTLTDTSVVQPCDSREDDITTLVFARERFQSSGKRV